MNMDLRINSVWRCCALWCANQRLPDARLNDIHSTSLAVAAAAACMRRQCRPSPSNLAQDTPPEEAYSKVYEASSNAQICADSSAPHLPQSFQQMMGRTPQASCWGRRHLLLLWVLLGRLAQPWLAVRPSPWCPGLQLSCCCGACPCCMGKPANL